MANQFSLAHLTLIGFTPPELIEVAARTGYDFVSPRLIPMGVPGEADWNPIARENLKKTKAALSDTGIKVFDIELARITAENDPKDYVPAMEAGAELGARHLISSAWTNVRTDRAFIVDRFAEICELAEPFGLTVNLEFPTFSRLTNLQEAVDIVRGANRPNSGILLDTLYYHFSKVSIEELAALPSSWFHFLHICDTHQEIPETREGLIHVARDARLYVGEGDIDFGPIFDFFPDAVFSLELPNQKRLKALGAVEHARRCLESVKLYLDWHRSSRQLYETSTIAG